MDPRSAVVRENRSTNDNSNTRNRLRLCTPQDRSLIETRFKVRLTTSRMECTTIRYQTMQLWQPCKLLGRLSPGAGCFSVDFYVWTWINFVEKTKTPLGRKRNHISYSTSQQIHHLSLGRRLNCCRTRDAHPLLTAP